MAKTITTTGTTVVTLTNLYNPLSITSTGTVATTAGSAVYGPAGATNNWTITNSGLLSTTDTAGAGIQLGTNVNSVQSGALSNGGTITGGAFGVFIGGPGLVTNQSSAYIGAASSAGTNNSAVYIQGDLSLPAGSQPGVQLVNAGTLAGPTGVFELQGGSITNISGGTIIGNAGDGVHLVGAGTALNEGVVSGSSVGILLEEGGSVTNVAGGVIEGSYGVFNYGFSSKGGDVTNAGTINGTAGYAVRFQPGGSSNYRLTVDPGAVFMGKIAGGNGALELGTGSSTGTLSGFGGTITNFSTLQFDQPARWSISGNATGLGAIGTITGFIGGDTIDVTDFAATSSALVGTILTLTGTSGSTTLNMVGSFASSEFQIASDGTGGTDITLPFNWTGTSGVWSTASDWDAGSVPTSVDNAVIAPTGTNFITVSGSQSVANVTLDGADDTLVVPVGGFLGATGTITIDAGQLQDTGGFTATQVIDNGELNIITNGTQSLVNAPVSLGGTLLVSSSLGGTLLLGAGEVVTQDGTSAVITSNGNSANAVVNQGTIDAGFTGGTMTIDPANFINQGTVAVSNGETLGVTSAVANGSSSGTFDVGGSGTANFAASVGSAQTLAFTDATGTLRLNQLGSVAASILNFVPGDTIDLPGVIADSATWSGGTLTIANGVSTVGTLSLPGDYSGEMFNAGTDNAGGSMVTVTPICYAAGTRILTPSGELPIELLHPGDLVLTISGRPQPIKWVGHRHADFRSHPNRQRILPVRIAAQAFGPGRPGRDLLLSPDHAVFVEGVLIPIRHLINGSNVTQVERETITYYHIELSRHDVLLADGMPAESYLEAGARSAFANGGDVIQLHPDFAPPQDYYATLWEQHGYAPLIVAGEVLERVRDTLAERRNAA